jgi:hypothetical protein
MSSTEMIADAAIAVPGKQQWVRLAGAHSNPLVQEQNRPSLPVGEAAIA